MLNIEQLRTQYESIYGKSVPNRFANDIDWLNKKVSEKSENNYIDNSVDNSEAKIGDEIDILKPTTNININKQSTAEGNQSKEIGTSLKGYSIDKVIVDSLGSNRESFEGIQSFHGFTKEEAFLNKLDKYNLTEREKGIVTRYVKNKTVSPELSNLSYILMKDWVRPIIMLHGLTSKDIVDEENLANTIFNSYLAMKKNEKDENGNMININKSIESELMVKSQQEAETVIKHNIMMKNSLSKKRKIGL